MESTLLFASLLFRKASAAAGEVSLAVVNGADHVQRVGDFFLVAK